MALIEKLENIGDAIRAKTGKTDLLTLDQMPIEIAAIETGGGDLPEEALRLTGNCQYKFVYDQWNWFINEYGNRVTTDTISAMTWMFASSKTLENIPFEINGYAKGSCSMSRMFYGCEKLKSLPKINNLKPANIDYIFNGCKSLREIPEDYCEGWDWTGHKTGSSMAHSYMLADCFSLRKFPMDLFKYMSPTIGYTSCYFYGNFSNCTSLDELVDLPIPYTTTWTGNAFSSSFRNACRLKNVTFEKNEDGTPKVVNWKGQTIDLTTAGAANYTTQNYIVEYNSGITIDKRVADDASYQALKNDPDWYTSLTAYSRYNHDSAVATINSLPDTSAYLATQSSGTNTIKFNGGAGANTDGGAINTLTEEEIAVATAKGWTVTLV